MLLRIIIILIIAAITLIFFGVRESILLSGTRPEPLEVELAALEEDRSIKNNHIRIGSHFALYSAAIFEYEYDQWSNNEYSDSSPVNYAYYPIISETHPFLKQVDALETRYGNIDTIPDEEWPEIENIAVLVKTTEFSTVGDIPEDWVLEETVKGIVINKIKALDDEEKQLMQENFPLADMDKVLILDKGREPASPLIPNLMIGGGVFLILLIIGLFVRERTSGKKP